MAEYVNLLKNDPAASRIYAQLKKNGVKDEELDRGSITLNDQKKPQLLWKENGNVEPQEVYDYVLARPEKYGDLFIKETGLTIPWSIPEKSKRTEKMRRYVEWMESQVSSVKDEMSKAGIAEKNPRYTDTLIASLLFMIEGKEPEAMMKGFDKSLLVALAGRRKEPPWGAETCPKAVTLVDHIEGDCKLDDVTRIATYGNSFTMAGLKPVWSVITEKDGNKIYFPTIGDDRGNMIFPPPSVALQRIASPRLLIADWSHKLLSSKEPTVAADILEAATRLSDEFHESHREMALWHIENTGRQDKVEQALKRILEMRPDDVVARKGLASALIKQNKIEEAAEQLRIVASGKVSVETRNKILLGLFDLLKSLNRLDEALDAAKGLDLSALKRDQLINYHNVAGHWLLNAGRYEEGKNHISKAVKLDPTNLELLQTLVLADILTSDLNAALAAVKAYMSKAPASVDGFVLLAKVYSEMKNFPKTADAYEEAIALEPKNRELWELLLKAHSLSGDSEEFFSACERCALQFPKDASALARIAKMYADAGDASGAARHSDAALAVDPANTIALTVKARVLSSAGDKLGAAELLQKATSIDPSDSEAWSMLGNINLELKRYGPAIVYFQKAVEVDNSAPAPNVLLGFLYNDLGRKSESAEAFGRADPSRMSKDDRFIYHSGYSVVLLSLKRYPEAKEQALKAVAINPSHAKSHQNLAEACYRQSEFECALRHSLLSVKFDPTSTFSLTMLANTYRGLGRHEEAYRTFKEVVAHNPDQWFFLFDLGVSAVDAKRLKEADKIAADLKEHPDPSARIAGQAFGGLVLMERGMIDEALAAITKALDANILHPALAFRAGLIKLHKGLTEEALKLMNLAVKLSPESAVAHHYLGVVQAIAGDFAGAENSIRHSLKINPSDTLAKKNLARVIGKKPPILPPIVKDKKSKAK